MRGISLLIAAIAVLTAASCAWKDMTPATEIVYEGDLTGNVTVTYPSAEKVLEICIMTKACMGLSEYSYALPKIRGMKGGNAVECGGTLRKGCYEAADNGDARGGLVIVPEGGDIDIIAHECVHHWLYMHTGDLDPKHESGLFLTCGGSYMLDEGSE
ncbi:MAG: hypothetical protein AB1598_13950 [Thermodesulfobacteriota bacterium]